MPGYATALRLNVGRPAIEQMAHFEKEDRALRG